MLDFWEAYERSIQKISWGTSQFVDWASCAVLIRSKMVWSGDVPSNCSLASFRHARFFDFFNEIALFRSLPRGERPVTAAAAKHRLDTGNRDFAALLADLDGRSGAPLTRLP